VRGLFQTLASLLREEGLVYTAMAFDDVAALEAREQQDTDNIQSQYPLAVEVGYALGIDAWVMSDFSADDAIASAAHRYSSEAELSQIVICSSDNDFAQCVRGERIVVWNRIRKERMGEAGVLRKFGVPPERIPEYLALVGDKSDGIPGIPGFGPKASSAVIRRYGPMEEIPMDVGDWDVEIRGKERLAATLRERRAEAIGYRDASIKSVEAPLPDSLEDLRHLGADRDHVEALSVALEDPAMLERQIRYRDSSRPPAQS
jgi:5'-3' exonuclease